MKELKKLEDYYKNNEIDIDQIIEDFTPYITTIINNRTDNKISFEDKEEIFSDTFFIVWKNRNRINNQKFNKRKIQKIQNCLRYK